MSQQLEATTTGAIMSFIYKLEEGNMRGWRELGDIDTRQTREDVSLLAIALLKLQRMLPEEDCLRNNEYWITPCPLEREHFVIIRLRSNPFDCGYLISPIELPYLGGPLKEQL